MASNNTTTPPSTVDKEQLIGMMEKEMEYRVELFNKYKEAELYIGETSCIDRCVSKYWQGFFLVFFFLFPFDVHEIVNNLIGQLISSRRPPV
ncbi:hypothetical protein ACJIZ3_017889 [Penstemon smallii]|uniref:Mitochondrial import inner membrane translocase subunit n=1 Tax=Penstemon smallii TaxID=265156 RepID=A0ABD3SY51_9LAMI